MARGGTNLMAICLTDFLGLASYKYLLLLLLSYRILCWFEPTNCKPFLLRPQHSVLTQVEAVMLNLVVASKQEITNLFKFC